MLVNGREYPLWNQFIEKKDQFIGGVMEDDGDSMDRAMGLEQLITEITDIQLVPNGEESAMFQVVGKDFTCGFDVEFGGVGAGKEGYVTFRGYGGHTWRIKTKDASVA